MSDILYENGKKIGEISDWAVIEKPAVTKTILGKVITTLKPLDECSFISPKPVAWASSFFIVNAKKEKLFLKIMKIKNGTFISAEISSRESNK